MPLPPAEGPVVSDSWRTSRKAVIAFTQLCLEEGWVFTETPEQTDFGKDGYLDFADDGHLTGQCIALQIKGGSSYRSSGGYRIPASDRTRALWLHSTVPVFAIIWDPEGGIYWLDLTARLRTDGEDAALEIPRSNRIDIGDPAGFLMAMWQATSSDSIGAAFGSSDGDAQTSAVYDCLGLGRSDPQYLILLRRVMFGLEPSVLDHAIHVLNGCSLNMDLFLDPSWMSMANRAAVRRHFRWSTAEAVQLLERVQDEDGFERGSFSQCIYWLLVGDDPNSVHFVELVEEAALQAARIGQHHAAQWALVLRVYWAGSEGQQVFDRLVTIAPSLADGPITAQVVQQLQDFGHLSI